jgi:hypothetical protein
MSGRPFNVLFLCSGLQDRIADIGRSAAAAEQAEA